MIEIILKKKRTSRKIATIWLYWLIVIFYNSILISPKLSFFIVIDVNRINIVDFTTNKRIQRGVVVVVVSMDSLHFHMLISFANILSYSSFISFSYIYPLFIQNLFYYYVCYYGWDCESKWWMNALFLKQANQLLIILWDLL